MSERLKAFAVACKSVKANAPEESTEAIPAAHCAVESRDNARLEQVMISATLAQLHGKPTAYQLDDTARAALLLRVPEQLRPTVLACNAVHASVIPTSQTLLTIDRDIRTQHAVALVLRVGNYIVSSVPSARDSLSNLAYRLLSQCNELVPLESVGLLSNDDIQSLYARTQKQHTDYISMKDTFAEAPSSVVVSSAESTYSKLATQVYPVITVRI